MSKLFDQAVETVRRLSVERQDEIARLILQIADDDRLPEEIAPEHLDAVLEGLAQASRGEFASDAEVRAAFRKFDR